EDVAYATSKLFFAYGLGASLYFPLAAGASVVLSPEPFAPARTWKILSEERPSLFFAVPAVYRALLDHAPPGAEDAVAGLRRLVSAGEALSEAIFLAWKERFGQEIIDGLGSTEALHVFLSNRPGDCIPGTLGRPVPGCEVIGCAGESGLMELVACVVSLPGEEEAVGERVERACAEGLPRFKRPKRVVLFASLPRTATGKVQRFVLRDLARVAHL